MIIKLPFLPWDINIHRRNHKKVAPQQPHQHHSIIRIKKYDKVFCIGAGKTGTTSLEKLLSQFGYKMGNQPVGEVLSRDWLINKNAERIIQYCYTADAFQDAPFSYPGLYKELDRAFPNSKFILTVRNNPEEWFASLVKFHTKLFSSDLRRPPNEDDLKNAVYRYKGYIFENHMFLYGYPTIPLYDASAYKDHYVRNNEEKRAYFMNRPNDFIEINLAVKDDFQRLCEFLNVETDITSFPWLNKSN